MRSQPGQCVRFLERSRFVYANVGQTRRASGHVWFTPRPRGRRQIVADVDIDGRARLADVVVGSFRAPAPPTGRRHPRSLLTQGSNSASRGAAPATSATS